MLQTIRNLLSNWFVRIILGGLVVSFVFWGIKFDSNASNYAANVNGDKISLRDAQFAWQKRLSELQKSFRAEIPDSLKKSEQQAALDRLIRTQLLQQQINKVGYGVSDDALNKAIHEYDAFKVDGKFDPQRYTALLQSAGKSKMQFEQEYRNDLAMERLQNAVMNTAFVTPAEATRTQALLNEQRDVEYATISAKSFLPAVNVSDAEVQAYYEVNKNSYLTTETVGLQYVELKLSDVASDVSITEAALRAHYEQIKDKFSTPERRRAHHILIAVGNGVDDATAKKQADDLYAKIKSGGNFEQLAKEHSKDPGSAVKGGDLGWQSRGYYVKPFEDALFSMSPGEIRGPVKSDFGYHIIRLDEVENNSKTYEQVRAEVEADYRNEQAHSAFYDLTQKLADAAFSKMNELDSVAKEFNTTVKSIPDFTRNGGGEFAKGSPVIDAAFSEAVLEKGQNSPLITIGEDRALVVRINDHKLPEQKSLDQVRGDILAILKDNVAKATASQKTAELVKQLRDGSLQWSAAIKQVSATLTAKQTISRSAKNVPAPVIQAAFSLPKTAVSADKSAFGNVELENGDCVVVAVSAVKSGSELPNAAQQLPALQAQEAAMMGRQEFVSYVQELERIAKIEKNPAAFD